MDTRSVYYNVPAAKHELFSPQRESKVRVQIESRYGTKFKRSASQIYALSVTKFLDTATLEPWKELSRLPPTRAALTTNLQSTASISCQTRVRTCPYDCLTDLAVWQFSDPSQTSVAGCLVEQDSHSLSSATALMFGIVTRPEHTCDMLLRGLCCGA